MDWWDHESGCECDECRLPDLDDTRGPVKWSTEDCDCASCNEPNTVPVRYAVPSLREQIAKTAATLDGLDPAVRDALNYRTSQAGPSDGEIDFLDGREGRSPNQ
jgi:hypothetical protein